MKVTKMSQALGNPEFMDSEDNPNLPVTIQVFSPSSK